MKVAKKAAIAFVAAMSLAFISAAPASATNTAPCEHRNDLLKIYHQGGATCFANSGTIAYDMYQVVQFHTGDNSIKIAYVDEEGRLRTKDYGKWTWDTGHERGDGTQIPLFPRIYQIWIF